MAFQGDSIYWVEVEKIVPNPYQPRRDFDEGRLHELAESVRMYGVLQPLTVTRREVSREDGTFYTEYELIAGERRLRASRLAGISQVPVIIRSGEQTDQEKLELAIIENLQREDLNAVDRAVAFKQLAEQFKMSHSQVAKKVGRSREYVSNTLRLLQLPEHILTAIKGGDIMEGHGRTLLMLSDRPEEQDTIFREAMLKKLSVREVERIARKIATDKVRKKSWQGTDPALMEIEKRFTDTLGTRVQIQKTDFGGKLTIDYFTNDDLEKLLAVIEQQERAMADAVRHVAHEALENSTPLDITEAEPTPESEPAPRPAPTEQDTRSWGPPQPESDIAHTTHKEQEPPFAEAAPSAQPTFPEQAPQAPEPEQEVPAQSAPTTPERSADETDLYTVRNFGI